MDPTATTTLLTLTGPDRPGVTTRLFAALTATGAPVLDVEQVVIRGQLILGVLLGTGDGDLVRVLAQPVADDLSMALGVTEGDAEGELELGVKRRERSHVTVLGSPLLPDAVAGVAGRIAELGANIDRIVRLAPYPVTAIELEVSGADPDALRTALSAEAAARSIDVAVERSGLHRRAKRLVVMDVDSTLIQGEVIELLAAEAGCLDEVARVTERRHARRARLRRVACGRAWLCSKASPRRPSTACATRSSSPRARAPWSAR